MEQGGTVPSDTLDRVWQRLGHWPGLNCPSPPQYSVLILSNYQEGNYRWILFNSHEPRLAGRAGARRLLLVRFGVSEHDLRLRPPAQLRHRLDVRLRLRQERRGLKRERLSKFDKDCWTAPWSGVGTLWVERETWPGTDPAHWRRRPSGQFRGEVQFSLTGLISERSG